MGDREVISQETLQKGYICIRVQRIIHGKRKYLLRRKHSNW